MRSSPPAGDATVYPVDLTDTEATQAATHAVGSDLGPISVLVNNVGWNGKAGFFLDLPPERWDQAYRLNLYPTFNATRAVLPGMVERRGGAIVSIASDAGFGEFRMGDYGPMKAGVMAFARIIAKEYGRYGVRSNTVCPGLVIPEPDAIGAGSLWQADIGFGEQIVADMEKATPLRHASGGRRHRRRRRLAGFGPGPHADRTGRQRVRRLQHAALTRATGRTTCATNDRSSCCAGCTAPTRHGRGRSAAASMHNPATVYTSPERFAAELRVLFRGQPVLVALSCELREPGSFVTLTVGDVPLAVVRQPDGSVQGLRQRLSPPRLDAADGAVRRWAALDPLPVPRLDLRPRRRASGRSRAPRPASTTSTRRPTG